MVPWLGVHSIGTVPSIVYSYKSDPNRQTRYNWHSMPSRNAGPPLDRFPNHSWDCVLIELSGEFNDRIIPAVIGIRDTGKCWQIPGIQNTLIVLCNLYLVFRDINTIIVLQCKCYGIFFGQ